MNRSPLLAVLLLGLSLAAACAPQDPFRLSEDQMQKQQAWMHQAVAAGDPNAIRETLLFGTTMLHPRVMADGLCEAAEKGDLKVVEALLQSGAQLKGEEPALRTPLMCAAHGGHENVVRYLLGRGARPNRTDREGRTSLHYAVGAGGGFGELPAGWDSAGRENVIARLVAEGGNPNAADNEGRTPLHHAVAGGDLFLVKVLLAVGASPAMADKQGQSPADLALERGFTEALGLFADSGVTPP